MLMLSPQCNFSSYHVSNLYIEKEKVLVQNLLLTSGKLRPSGASLLHVLVPCNKTDKGAESTNHKLFASFSALTSLVRFVK